VQLRDAAADDVGGDPATGGFHFGQFGHAREGVGSVVAGWVFSRPARRLLRCRI
jgi:hypothetical protein